MEATKRRKLDDGDEDGWKKATCVLHMTTSNSEQFTYINNCKDPITRFARIKEIRDKRLSQPLDSPNRMSDVCARIPNEISEYDGYHRDCYSAFTTNLCRLKDCYVQMMDASTVSVNTESEHGEGEKLPFATDKFTFSPECVFCDNKGRKAIKKSGVWSTEGTIFFESDGSAEAVLKEANKRVDYKMLQKISGFDLYKCKAKYHSSCRNFYMAKKPESWRSVDHEQIQRQIGMEAAHKRAFEVVCEIVYKKAILEEGLVKLSDLREVYVSSLEGTGYENQNYRSENLKVKLEKHEQFKNQLYFCPIGGKFQSYLIFSRQMDMCDSVRRSYELGRKDEVKNVASVLNQEVKNAFKNQTSPSWPYNASDLTDVDVVPEKLKKFLTLLFTTSESHGSRSARVSRLVNSIGQDICRAVTNGEWKLPKHVLLGMSLRHLFRNAELIRLINRLGHCENYSFLLELETAIAESVQSSSTLLPLGIVRKPSAQSLFHSDFDNFDEYVNDINGAGSVHRSHGIMLQEVPVTSPNVVEPERPAKDGSGDGHSGRLPGRAKTGKRSFKPMIQHLDDYHVRRRDPKLTVSLRATDGAEEARRRFVRRNMLWIILRLHSAQSQTVPGWAGYISKTGDVPKNLTTIEYYPVIAVPITEDKAVKECLRYAEEATSEVGQKYVITTFDLGVCMKAFPLIWSQSSNYSDHIILIGTFHLVCGYFKMLGKKMDCTGLSDVFIESNLITPGSLQGVISGTSYSRALNCHKVMVEALERLLYEKFAGSAEPYQVLPTHSKNLLDKLKTSPSKKTEEEVLKDPAIIKLIDNFIEFRETVREGKLGKTAKLWMSYIDHVWLVLSLLEAVKRNDFLVYTQCICLMPDLFFSFHGHNYARYLTYFSMFIVNIETSHPGATDLLKKGAISVARSMIPGNRCAVDKTIEETFMRHAKSRGGRSSGAGLSGMNTNHGAYQRWVRSASERAKYLQATYSFAEMGTEKGNVHRDLGKSEMKRVEQKVKNTIQAIKNFNNPFTMTEEKLYCISSGAAVSDEVAKDVLRAEVAGCEAKDAFISNRLEKNKDFFEPVKKMKLKTMAAMNKTVKVKTSDNKKLLYQQQGNIAFKLLVKSQQAKTKLDLEELLAYPLVPVPYSIGLPDNYLVKTDKSKGLKHVLKGTDVEMDAATRDGMLIEDGNAIFHCLRNLPDNFESISELILKFVLPNSPVIFSTDMYMSNSVKSVERKRRGCGEKLIINVKTRRPVDWKSFLSNESNKEQLVQVLLSTWGSEAFAEMMDGCDVTLICEGHAFRFVSDGKSTVTEEIPALHSSQEETDSRVILYCFYAKEKGHKCVRVKSPDTDIFFIMLHYASQLQGMDMIFDTGKGNSRRFINITQLAHLLEAPVCNAFLGVHAFSGCDSASAFKGKGKVKALNLVRKHKEFQEFFMDIGERWELSKDLYAACEKFTCALYGRGKFTDVNKLRHFMLKSKCNDSDDLDLQNSNFDLSALPPCKDALRQHLNRVNYQVAIWKRAHVANPTVPDPANGHGWERDETGQLVPNWTDGEIMPAKLADVLQKLKEPENEDESDEDFDPCAMSSDDDSSDDDNN